MMMFCSVAKSCLTLCNSMQEYVRFLCPSLSPGACPNSSPLNLMMLSNHFILHHPLSSCLQSFPASGSFLMSQFFPTDGQTTGASAAASILPVNIQDWFPLGLTGLISLLSKGLSRVFSSTTIQKHQFFSAQSSLWSNSHINTWLLEKP